MSQKKCSWDLTPDEMRKEVCRYVIGQDQTVAKLTDLYWRNNQRRLAKQKGISPRRYPPKVNLGLIAPTGGGKTHLLTTFGDLFEIPFVTYPVTSLSSEGYLGGKARNIVEALLAKAGGNESVARRGVVHLDEIDKIRATGRIGDVGGIAVQEQLLTYLEGAPIVLSDRREFDLSDVMFVGTGAFEGLERNGNEAGVSEESLVSFGLNRQFLARFNWAWMNELGEEDLRRILTEGEGSVAKRMINAFRDWKGADLEFERGAIDAIVSLAKKKGTGARGLNDVFETHLRHVAHILPGRAPSGVKSFVVEAETVTKGQPPRVIHGKSSFTPIDLRDFEAESEEKLAEKKKIVVIGEPVPKSDEVPKASRPPAPKAALPRSPVAPAPAPPPAIKAPEPTAPPPASPAPIARPAVVPTTTPSPLSRVPYAPRLLRTRKKLIGFSCVALALFLVLFLYQLLRPVKAPEGGKSPIPPEGLPTPGLIERLKEAEPSSTRGSYRQSY
jgi:ATP-dependent Clp protease ATP-binding subunit ClpX